MADGENCILDSSRIKIVGIDIIKINNDTQCIHCDKLKRELQKAKLEISSYEEILKLIQEEMDADQSTLKTPVSRWRKDLATILPRTDNTANNNEWTQVFSKNHTKSTTKSGNRNK
jgi:hypothetical protein